MRYTSQAALQCERKLDITFLGQVMKGVVCDSAEQEISLRLAAKVKSRMLQIKTGVIRLPWEDMILPGTTNEELKVGC